MNKQELIKLLNSWDTNMVWVDDGKDYRKIKTVSRGLGKGVIIYLEEKEE